MIHPQYYSTIYLAAVTILTLCLSYRYSRYKETRALYPAKESIGVSLILFIGLTLFIGLRPISYLFVDMVNYAELYPFVNIDENFTYGWSAQNLIFDNYYAYMSLAGIDISYFFLVTATIYFGCMLWACRKMFPADTLYTFVIILAAFSTYSFGTNGIKAGAAASVFLLAIAYSDRKLISILFAVLSFGFHHSMTLVIIAFILTMYVKNPKIYLAGWLFCVLCAAAHVNPFYGLMVGLADDTGVNYLTSSQNEWGGKLGFRIDFIAYSASAIALGYYYIFKKGVKSQFYTRLFNMYLAVNGVWVLCMYIPFNNRIAYLSWFMLPIVAIYPLLKEPMRSIQQYKMLNKVASYYLLFTLFMNIIYY